MQLDDWAQLYVSEDRQRRFREVLGQRLGCLTILFEHVGDPRNVSACIRVADSFGVGRVLHYADGRYHRNHQISMHTDRWVDVLNVQRFDDAVEGLRRDGFTLVGTVVDNSAALPFDQFEPPAKTALVLGSERDGLTPEMQAACTHLVTIPTCGFADSLNLATAAAILVRHFAACYRRRDGAEATLAPEEQERLYRLWIERDVRRKLRKRGIAADF